MTEQTALSPVTLNLRKRFDYRIKRIFSGVYLCITWTKWEFKEKDQTEVELPEKSCQDVSEMIRFIHPGFGDDLEGGVDSAL
jgi:hypothetical protein